MTHTLEGIARLAGVSRSTVSRVINNHPSVKPEVREHVWQIIRQVGYQPHAAARSLVTKRTHVIGLFIPRAVTALFGDPFFPLLIRGITDTCNAHGCHLMLSLCSGHIDPDDLYRQVLRGGYLDGVVVASTNLDDPLVPRLIGDGVRFLSVGAYPDSRVSYVDVDNVSGTRMAVEHLLRQGRRRIATICGPRAMVAGRDRLAGYRQALEARGMAYDEALVAEGDFSEDGGRAAMQRLLAQAPDALFAASDMMAIGAIKALREAGRRIPQDVAIVGFDDLPLASIMEPGLTTVRQPIERLGAMAAEVLLDLVEGRVEGPQHVILPVQLVVRQSCGSR
ncbi:MAG TPA: LacI family DNA-binding transcriptional regulator [Anaerolineae bacterium]|nr:LacI family DNA-binding transcriptional regulator [Anaerolineae bacterium]HOQ99269.1 LacI family DNA-binding transcriptional regulator [Anaerolineae bacterium]HPL30702.1 LacI family DNA-binding transcriptional regulator [Anaerolineae bacterium]